VLVVGGPVERLMERILGTQDDDPKPPSPPRAGQV
jgi:hypothetical protein